MQNTPKNLTEIDETVETTQTRRDRARQKAEILRDLNDLKHRRKLVYIWSGAGFAVVALALFLVFSFAAGSHKSEVSPLNMATDGVTVGAGLQAAPADTRAIADDPAPEPSATDGVQIRVYYDYLCENCWDFFSANGDQLRNWASAGKVQLDLHPIAVVSAQNSLTATNAASCVANYQPDSFFDFNAAMFNVSNSADLVRSNTALDDLAENSVANPSDDLTNCIKTGFFNRWVTNITDRALNGVGVPSSIGTIDRSALPVVSVNGAVYNGSLTDPTQFAQFVLQVDAQSLSTSSTTN